QVDLGMDDVAALSVRRASAAALVASLPERQRQVLEAMAKGALNKQIAYDLGIAEKTVKMHRMLLLERLGGVTSAEAIRIAAEAGAIRRSTRPPRRATRVKGGRSHIHCPADKRAPPGRQKCQDRPRMPAVYGPCSTASGGLRFPRRAQHREATTTPAGEGHRR